MDVRPINMKLIRKGLIKENEAKILLEAIKEKGELIFPLNQEEIVAVKETIQKAQSGTTTYQPSIWEKLNAKWNYSYASVASFGLWVGALNIEVENSFSKEGTPALRIKLRSNHQIEWDALKAGAFHTHLI